MALYFLLGTLTTEGQQRVYDNPDLVVEATGNISVAGAEILGRYAVLGHYDFLMMIQADDNEAVARLSLEVGVRTGMHIETLPGIAMGFLTDPHEGEGSNHPESVQLTVDQT
jgi:uncharacterized protein with GYD domain